MLFSECGCQNASAALIVRVLLSECECCSQSASAALIVRMLLSECECCSQSASAALGVLLSDCFFHSPALRVRALLSECDCCSRCAVIRLLLILRVLQSTDCYQIASTALRVRLSECCSECYAGSDALFGVLLGMLLRVQYYSD